MSFLARVIPEAAKRLSGIHSAGGGEWVPALRFAPAGTTRELGMGNETATPINEKWVPYKHPQPKESPPELVIPNAIPTDERIWVPVEENVWFRPLLMCVSRGTG
jgi:hypothetical protein